MDKEYLKKKIKEFLKERSISLEEVNESDFVEWLNSKRDTTNKADLLNDLNLYPDFFESTLDFLKITEKNTQLVKEIYEKLYKEFLGKPDIHIGTLYLRKWITDNFSLDYDNTRIRYLVYGAITKIRQDLKLSVADGSYLISGKVMKDFVGLTYEGEETIDGWCYTKNIKIVKDYFEHELAKYRDLSEAYESLRKIWESK